MNSSDNFDDNEVEENENIETKIDSAEEDEEEEENEDYDDVRSQSGVKEISAPYSVPHYPIELEEQRKQMALKELEERTHPTEDQSMS